MVKIAVGLHRTVCIKVTDADETHNTDILTLLEEDLEVGERFGPAVAEKLATIARARFPVRLPEQKLKDKLGKYPPPENCSELKPPILNAELGDKGCLDAGAKKTDSRLVNVQKMICAAATGVLSSMQLLHTSALAIAGRLSDPRDKAQFDTDSGLGALIIFHRSLVVLCAPSLFVIDIG